MNRSAPQHVAAVALALVAWITVQPAPAFADQVGEAAACNQPMPDPVAHVNLGDRPNGFTFTRDGCWFFVSVDRQGLIVLNRTNGIVSQVRALPFQSRVQRFTLTHDERILIVPAGTEVVFLDVAKLTSTKDDPVLGRITDRHFSGASEARVTSDDKYVFVKQEQTAWTSIIDLDKARATHFGSETIVGGFPNQNPLLGMALSPDDRYLYTVHLELPGGDGPASCRNTESFRPRETRKGGVVVTDVQRAISGSAFPSVTSFRIGCGGSSLTLSPDGNTLYVAGDDTLIAYDMRPIGAGAAPVVLATLPIRGVQVNTFDDGKRIAIGGPDARPMVIDAAKLAAGKEAILGTIAGSGSVTRLLVTADGSALITTSRDPNPNTLVIVDLKRLKLEPLKP